MKRPVLSAVALALAACGAAHEQQTPEPFIAFASDFQPFRTWESAHVDAPAGGDSTHPLGPFTVYWNRRPAHGSAHFPVGTMIVKFVEQDPPITLAMAKRGGGYNPDGAAGWEWFELDPTIPTAVMVKWRGLGPPIGGAYGGNPLTCNSCHASGEANDFVLSQALQLSGF